VRRLPPDAAVSPRAGRDSLGGGRMMTGIQLRRLKLADIPATERVGRRAYTTPWSRTMFAGEIAKPTSRCFGAFDDERLAGYLIVSRSAQSLQLHNLSVSVR